MYLCWFDDNAKRPAETKILDAIAAYRARFHSEPAIVLVNEADAAFVQGIEVRIEARIQRNNFQVGLI